MNIYEDKIEECELNLFMVLKSKKEMEAEAAEKAKKEDSEKEILKVAEAEKAKKDGDADVKKEADSEHVDKCKHCGKSDKDDVAKAGAAGQDPAEDAALNNVEAHTTSPGAGISGGQQVLAGNSGVHVARTQNVPVEQPMHKSLNDSPVFLEMTKQLTEMKKSISSELAGLRSEMAEVKEIKKSVDEAKASIKEFYSQSFRKHIQEDVSVLEKSEGNSETFTERLNKGGLRFG